MMKGFGKIVVGYEKKNVIFFMRMICTIPLINHLFDYLMLVQIICLSQTINKREYTGEKITQYAMAATRRLRRDR